MDAHDIYVIAGIFFAAQGYPSEEGRTELSMLEGYVAQFVPGFHLAAWRPEERRALWSAIKNCREAISRVSAGRHT